MEMDNVKQHELLLQQIHDTYIKKNHDYGDSFSRSYKKYGLVAAMVRMEDKWNRLDNLASGAEQKVSDESIRDTLLDLAGYCVMTIMELDKQKSVENQKAFEEQLREFATNPIFSTINPNKSDVILPDEEDKHHADNNVIVDDLVDAIDNADIDVGMLEKPKKEKKTVDEGKVMALYNAKWSQKKIADEMGCSQSKICQIIKAHKINISDCK